MFLFQLLQNIRKGGSQREKFSHPDLSCQNGNEDKKKKIIGRKKKRGICDNTVIIQLTGFNKPPSEILLGMVKAPLSFSSPFTHSQDLLQQETPIFSSKSSGKKFHVFAAALARMLFPPVSQLSP